MIAVERNKDLRDLHTFAVPWRTEYFADATSIDALHDGIRFARDNELQLLILGGGSNLLPTEKWPGLVLRNSVVGRTVVSDDEAYITMTVGAGEDWHEFVAWCVEHNYYGIENLALIPGTVGAAPVQNIGAYGVEAAHVVVAVEAIDTNTLETKTFTTEECEFGYRDSFFKQHAGDWCITSVTFKLSKEFKPVLTYGKLQNITTDPKDLTAQHVFDKVIQIRQSVMPDWHVTGTAGSFFASPVVDEKVTKKLKKKWPELVFYDLGGGQHKIPGGWLTERCKLDKTVREQFVYKYHNLVLVNNFKGSSDLPIKYGKQIEHAAKKIKNTVKRDFGIILEPEVLIL